MFKSIKYVKIMTYIIVSRYCYYYLSGMVRGARRAGKLSEKINKRGGQMLPCIVLPRHTKIQKPLLTNKYPIMNRRQTQHFETHDTFFTKLKLSAVIGSSSSGCNRFEFLFSSKSI